FSTIWRVAEIAAGPRSSSPRGRRALSFWGFLGLSAMGGVGTSRGALRQPDRRIKMTSSCPGLSRASTSYEINGNEGVDGRDKPGHDEENCQTPLLRRRSQDLSDPVVRVGRAAVLDVDQLLAQPHGDGAGRAAANEKIAARGTHLADRRDDGRRAA